jgi:hypothetical protein
METGILEAACLLQLQTGTWQASKILKEDEIKEISDPDWIRARKLLVDPDFLSGPKTIISRGRKYLKNITLPFPIPGLILIARESIAKVDSKLLSLKGEFFTQVEEICKEYPFAYDVAREKLSEQHLFNEADYPKDLRPCYKFDWRYLDIRVPNQLQLISPELYRRKVEEFETMMKEAQEVAVAALYEELTALVESMVDRLGNEEDGKPKKFKDSLVKNFTDFFETFSERNIFKNDQLDEIVSRAKFVLSDVTADGLRKFTDVRAKIANEMGEVKKIIQDASVDLPRRKIKFDPIDKAA